jgi:plasmid maintenance system antidote protein VapI
MPSLIEEMPAKIQRLEEKFGSDNQFVQDLKRQYERMKANQGKTSQDVYRMAAVNFSQK